MIEVAESCHQTTSSNISCPSQNSQHVGEVVVDKEPELLFRAYGGHGRR